MNYTGDRYLNKRNTALVPAFSTFDAGDRISHWTEPNAASTAATSAIVAMRFQRASSATRSIIACPPVPFRPALR